VLCRSGECEWEPGNNRVLEVPVSAAEMQVAGQWGDTSDTEALEVRLLPECMRYGAQLVDRHACCWVLEPAAVHACAA
jgi:hypothetical protein